jgi:hypothetical protein
MRNLFTKVVLVLAISCGWAGLCVAASEEASHTRANAPTATPWRAAFQGIDSSELSADSPRLMRGHAVRIDLQSAGIEFLATPPNDEKPGETDGKKTSTFLSTYGCQVAINASPFAPIHMVEGQPQDVDGLMVSQGDFRSKSTASSATAAGTG